MVLLMGVITSLTMRVAIDSLMEYVCMESPKSVVVLGAGVAGIKIVKELQRRLPDAWRLVLVDENDYHQYLYRIHEVCNAEFQEEDIIVPLEKIVDMDETEFRRVKVESVDPDRGLVITDEGEMGYDLLAVCLGSHPAYFGIEGIRGHSLTLGSYEQALEIRSRILQLFTETRETGDSVKIVIGGGGFSGVELAGELLDWLPRLYEENGLAPPEKLLTVVEAFPSILPGWEKSLSLEAQRNLEGRGAEFVFNDPVTRVGEDRLETRSGLVLKKDLFIWTGGVEHDPACGLGFEVNGRRIAVDKFCRAVGHERVFVAGDSACAVDSEGQPQPPTAHIAMAQGGVVAHNILAQVRGSRMEEYRFERVGEIVTLGRSDAVGVLFGFKFRGLLARLLKKMVNYWYVATIGGLRLLLWG